MGLIQFQKLEEKQIDLKSSTKSMVIRRTIDYDNLEDSLFFCLCNHPDYSHYLNEGECHFPDCDCQKMIFNEVEILVEITLADIFSFQNPNLIPDSIYWWEDFKEFIACNRNIL